jgi:hypothetical protein
MLPPSTRLDPSGYYRRLGLDPAAPRASIAAAYRAKARVLHPDVPRTGNAEAFVAVKQAYDILSNPARRAEYDRSAGDDAEVRPEAIVSRPAFYHPAYYRTAFSRPGFSRQAFSRTDFYGPMVSERWLARPLSAATIVVLAGLAAFLCLSVYQVAAHLMVAPAPSAKTLIRPNAATVEPLSPQQHRAVLYGPAPVRLGGTPNFYVVPAGSPAVLWQQGTDRNALVPVGQLPPFSAVQAVRLIRQSGMLEVLLNGQSTGFVSADHLMPGDTRAARTAYCSYNSGPAPFDGELLERRGIGGGALSLDNRAIQPAVVKLRDPAGAVAIAVFLSPGSHADLTGLPDGFYRPEYAIGELWSRACNAFAAGMRARRMDAGVTLPGAAPIVVAPDGTGAPASEITDQMFEQD